MESSRICVLTGIYPPDAGGPATFAQSFSEYAVHAGRLSEVISYVNGGDSTFVEEGVNISLVSRERSLIWRYRRAIKLIHSSFVQGSLVIANGCFIEVFVASIFSGAKYVAKVPGDVVWERARNSGKTNLDIEAFQKARLPLSLRIFKFLNIKSLRRAKAVIVPSKLLYDLCLTWGVESSKLTLISNSVDTDFFRPNSDSLSKVYDCIVVNRLVHWKHVDSVISACATLGLKLIVVGEGPEMRNLSELSRQLNIDIQFYGIANKSELLHLLNSSKIYILNSSFEATAYSLLEARAVGLICVANKNTGASEIIEDGIDGYLLNDTSPQSLIAVLSQIKNSNVQGLMQMGELARRNTQVNFSRKVNYERILKIIEDK